MECVLVDVFYCNADVVYSISLYLLAGSGLKQDRIIFKECVGDKCMWRILDFAKENIFW